MCFIPASNGYVAYECIPGISRPPESEVWYYRRWILPSRLIDYGFHAPTMSFGRRHADGRAEQSPKARRSWIALLMRCWVSVRNGAGRQRCSGQRKITSGECPHIQTELAARVVSTRTSREVAVSPTQSTRDSKYWPTVKRLDDVLR